MYPFGCKANSTDIQILLLKETEVIYNYKF